jgi:poly(A) polymerase
MSAFPALRDLSADPPEWLRWPETRKVLDILAGAGGEAKFVGGCVRDALLGTTSKDIDICTDLLPTETMDAFERNAIKVIPTGLDHGTVTVVIGHRHFEITTLRIDTQTHGRRAEVCYTKDWHADAARRDFTFNAIYLDPTGQIDDPMEGLPDLEKGRVRFIGNATHRIQEDYLRILRYFRFFARFGVGDPDQMSLNACVEHALLLNNLSGERIQKEFFLLLSTPAPYATIKLMSDNGVLEVILGTSPALGQFSTMLSLPYQTDAIQGLACLLGGKADVSEKLAVRLRVSNKTKSRLLDMCNDFLKKGMTDLQKKAVLYRVGKQEFLDQAVIYCAKNGDIAEMQSFVELTETWQIPVFPVTGSDLRTQGVASGPEMGKLLKTMEQKWISSGFSLDKQQLLLSVRTSSPDS